MLSRSILDGIPLTCPNVDRDVVVVAGDRDALVVLESLGMTTARTSRVCLKFRQIPRSSKYMIIVR